jgi:hypothetical protein
MNDAWATDWLGRFSGNEPTSIELYAEDARFEDITLRHAVRGRPALREFFGAFMNPAHRHNTFTFISYRATRMAVRSSGLGPRGTAHRSSTYGRRVRRPVSGVSPSCGSSNSTAALVRPNKPMQRPAGGRR